MQRGVTAGGENQQAEEKLSRFGGGDGSLNKLHLKSGER